MLPSALPTLRSHAWSRRGLWGMGWLAICGVALAGAGVADENRGQSASITSPASPKWQPTPTPRTSPTPPTSTPTPTPTTVIMISLDGTRPVDVSSDTLPSLVALAERGTSAPGLVPSTPSNTFPSHVTLVTGVEPNVHGIVNNFFIDEARGGFRKRDIPSWIEVEPLWSWLAGQGVASASYHWVGSEGPWRSGRGPLHWKPFASATPPRKKVETILGWLDLKDPAARPRLITSWFPGADHAAHLSGPGSRSAIRQLSSQDGALAQLIEGITTRGLWASTTLIVVSDHGMTRADTLIDFDAVLQDAGVKARVSGMGGFANVYLSDHLDEEARASAAKRVQALAAEAGLEAVIVGDVLADAVAVAGEGSDAGDIADAEASPRFTHSRFGDLVLVAPVGTAIHRPGLPEGGFHGYPSHEPVMHGIFVAAGRGVTRGKALPLLQSTDIAPTVLALLGVERPSWMKGSPVLLENAETQQ